MPAPRNLWGVYDLTTAWSSRVNAAGVAHLGYPSEAALRDYTGRPFWGRVELTYFETDEQPFLLIRPTEKGRLHQTEAGWSTLKTELLPLGSVFASLEEARLEVAHYLDTYFNLDRRHSALGYRSPHQFEQELKSNLP